MIFKEFRIHLNGLEDVAEKIEYISGLTPAEVGDMYDEYTEWYFFNYMFKRKPGFISDKENFDILSKFVKDWFL